MKTKFDHIVCQCNFTNDGNANYCGGCGSPLNDPQTNNHTGAAGNANNSYYRSDFGWHFGTPPNPGQPGFEEFWANHRIVEEDKALDSLSNVLAAVILFGGVYMLAKAFSTKQLKEGRD